MTQTMILGVGNLLLTDDGVGIHAIQQLQEEYEIPVEIQVVDGGTCGLDLLQYFDGVEHLIVVDAANLSQPPGSIQRMVGDQVPAFLAQKISPHEINLPELLFSAKLTGLYPKRVVVLGVQPQTIDTGVDLSPAVEGQVNELVLRIMQEIQ